MSRWGNNLPTAITVLGNRPQSIAFAKCGRMVGAGHESGGGIHWLESFGGVAGRRLFFFSTNSLIKTPLE
jgi:hypothetical protein